MSYFYSHSECCHAECLYPECRIFIAMQNVVVPSVILLNIVAAFLNKKSFCCSTYFCFDEKRGNTMNILHWLGLQILHLLIGQIQQTFIGVIYNLD